MQQGITKLLLQLKIVILLANVCQDLIPPDIMPTVKRLYNLKLVPSCETYHVLDRCKPAILLLFPSVLRSIYGMSLFRDVHLIFLQTEKVPVNKSTFCLYSLSFFF